VSVQDIAPDPMSEARGADGAGSSAVLLRRVVLVLALAGMLAFAGWPAVEAVADWRLPDNDDAMRVLQVRDWLAGQSWWDVHQHRFAPLDGGDMHWSRLADLPLALLAWPLGLLLGPEAGLKVAAFIQPPLLGLGCVALVALSAHGLSVRDDTARTATVAAIPMALLAFPAMTWFQPGRVDHHGLQVLLMLVALWGLVAQAREQTQAKAQGHAVRGAVLAGVAMAASLLIGLESAPVLVVMTGFVAVRWLVRGAAVGAATAAFAGALGLGLVALVVATEPPAHWMVRHHDAFSLIHLVPTLAGCAGLGAAALLVGGRSLVVRGIALAGVGGLVIAAALPFRADLLRGPYELLDPLLARLWLSRVGEAFSGVASIRNGQAGLAVAFAVPCLLALGAAAVVARWAWTQQRTAEAGSASGAASGAARQLDGAVLLVALLAVTGALSWLWQLRVSGQASVLAAVAVAVLAGEALARHGVRGLVRAVLLASPLVPGAVGTALAAAQPDQAEAAQTAEPAKTASTSAKPGACQGEAALAHLAGLPPTLAVTTIDMGAPLLLATPHSALAAPYHRNNRSLVAAYRLFMATPDEALGQARRLGAGLIVFCASAAEAEVLATEAPHGLMATLATGAQVAGLAPLPAPAGSDIKAWRVLPALP
jgi:hypothetical protein